MTEAILLGSVAIRCFGKKLEWDAPNMRFTNSEEANRHVNPPYRQGWSIEKARRYIERMAGIQFDPQVVEQFLALTDEGDEYFRGGLER